MELKNRTNEEVIAALALSGATVAPSMSMTRFRPIAPLPSQTALLEGTKKGNGNNQAPIHLNSSFALP